MKNELFWSDGELGFAAAPVEHHGRPVAMLG
jgi:hypothetical protein